MTAEDKALIQEAAKAAVAEFSAQHPCWFSANERAMVHSMHESMVEEEANHQTIRIMIQFGKQWQDVTGKLGRAVLFIFVAIVLLLCAKIVIPRIIPQLENLFP